jgi:integrase
VRPPRVRPSTWASYRMLVERHIVPTIGGVVLQRLTPAHLTAFYRALLDRGRQQTHSGLASKTVRNVHGVLHAALRDAVRWGYLSRNVAAGADLPKPMTPEMHVWNPEQLGVFLEHVRGDPLYVAWMLFATTGMRRGEVAGLRWSDVDLEAGRVSPRRPRVVVDYEVHVSEPKTAKGRRSLAAGVPAKVVSERLGHANIAITMDTYSHVLPGLDAQAADTVARLILGPAESSADPAADKPLTGGHPAADGGGGGEGRTTWSGGCASGGIRTPTGCPTGT